MTMYVGHECSGEWGELVVHEVFGGEGGHVLVVGEEEPRVSC